MPGSDPKLTSVVIQKVEVTFPPKINCRKAIPFDKVLCKQRHKIENMFGKLKDWLRISARYDRCAHTFFSAISINES